MQLFPPTAWRRSALALVCLFSVAVFAGPPKKVVVEVAIPAETQVDADVKAALEFLGEAVSAHLYTFDDPTLELPKSVVPEGTDFVAGETPLTVAGEQELYQSAHNATTGERLRLSPEQWASIYKKGYFLVPSRNFPGQFHKWDISLMEGTDTIRIFLKSADVLATQLIRIQIPNLVVGDTLSVRQGFTEMGKGLRGVLAHLVGFIETYPRHTPGEVATLIAEDTRKYLEGLAAASQGAKFDLRALDPALVQKAEPTLQAIEQAVDREYADAVQAAKRIADGDARKAKLAELEAAHTAQTEFFARIEASAELEKIGPGFAKVLARYGRALQRIRAHEINFQADLHAAVLAKRNELYQTRPSLVLDTEWLNAQLTATGAAYYKANWATAYASILEEIAGEYPAEAWALRNAMEYLKHDGWERARGLNKERLPLKKTRYDFWAFNADRWGKRKVEATNGQAAYWVLEPTSSVTVTSKSLGWKFGKIWYGTGWAFQAGLRTVLVDWFMNGPIGIRSWTRSTPYPNGYVLDSRTGEIVPSTKLNDTVWKDIGDLWRSVRKDRDDFAKAPDSGIYGKGPKRLWQFFWSDLGKGVVAPATVFSIRLLATGALSLVSGGVAVTSPIWAPCSASLNWAWTTLVADSYPVRDLPNYEGRDYTEPGLVVDTLRITVTGAGQVALSGALAVVGVPLAVVGTKVGSRIVGWARGLYNGLMYYANRGLALFTGARVPEKDAKFFAYHVEGPGVGANSFLAVDDDAVALAALLQLEVTILDAYQAQVHAYAAEPSADAAKLLASIPWAAFGLVVSPGQITRELANRINGPMAESLKRFDKLIADRKERLNPLLKAMAEVTQRYRTRGVRLSQDQLDRLLPQLELAYAKLLGDARYFPPTEPAVQQRFWDTNTEGVANSYQALLHRNLTTLLGRDALTPPSLDAGRFQTRVSHPSLRKMLGSVLTGNDLQVDVVTTDQPVGPIVPAKPEPVEPEPVTARPTRVPVTARNICGNEMAMLVQHGLIEGNVRQARVR